MKKPVSMTWISISAALALLVLATVPAHAQEEPRFTFNIGGGFSPLSGQITDRLQNGWHFKAGGGYRFTRNLETNLEFQYNGFGVKQLVLQESGTPAANSHLWGLTVDPKLHLHPFGKLDPYFAGGVGYFRRTVQFTQPTFATIFVFDPFFSFFPFPELVPANKVLGNMTASGVGGNAGFGFDFPLPRTARLFVEARYQYAATGNVPTRMVPVTIGIHW